MNEIGDWRKPLRSAANGNCVEVGVAVGGGAETAGGERVVGVRDTKQGGRGPVLKFSARAWKSFTDEVR